jgi:hypothetical protein
MIDMSLAEDPWSFIVIADPHIAETFASKNETHPWYHMSYTKHLSKIKHIKEMYSGELLLIPGDTNGGKWYSPSFARDKLGNASLTAEEAVKIASHGCYGTLRKLFKEGGYDNLLVALGDHELGGNGWMPGGLKNSALNAFREGFQLELNRDENGNFLHGELIGSVPSRPMGTIHENTSFAHRYKNVLFITIDCFHDKGFVFQDFARGLGGEGSITVTVEGKHLKWFEKVLKEARRDDSIKHIIVQAHVPILQPLRKVQSSGQFFDLGEESKFWKLMDKYNVDIYFAGEVHATTVSKRDDSNLLQVASRGNQFNNFLSISITDESIHISAFNEDLIQAQNGNNTYTNFGDLFIDKSGEDTEIEARGALEIFSVDKALIRFEFEKMFPLDSRQVIGIGDKKNQTPSQKRVRGVWCKHAMRNKGSLGQQYDAQVANLKLVPGRRGVNAAEFSEQSRFGIFARGPHGAGNIVSYNIWIKTAEKGSEMVLVHYGQTWGDLLKTKWNKDFHTLTLNNGNPTLYISPVSKLLPVQRLQLNDNKWHHISVSMSNKSCLLSEVLMYIDGETVETFVPKNDKHIFHTTSGSMSLAGFGYTSNFHEIFPNMKPFIGLMDEFIVFAKPVSHQLSWMTAPSYQVRYGTECLSNGGISSSFIMSHNKCKKKCIRSDWCKGYQYSRRSRQDRCTMFEALQYGERRSNTRS